MLTRAKYWDLSAAHRWCAMRSGEMTAWVVVIMKGLDDER
jgi:hypothetical protein